MTEYQTPEQIAAGLRPKLQKRLRLCAHRHVHWDDAPKSHRQLHAQGLVHEGMLDGETVAIATDLGRKVLLQKTK